MPTYLTSVSPAETSINSTSVSSGAVISSVLDGILSMYGMPKLDHKIQIADNDYQTSKRKLLAAIKHFNTRQDRLSRNELIDILHEEYVIKQKEYENALNKRDYFLDQVDKSTEQKPNSILSTLTSGFRYYLKDFFGSTPEQQIEKYKRIMAELLDTQQALTNYMRQLESLNLEEEPTTSLAALKQSIDFSTPLFPKELSVSSLDGENGFSILGSLTSSSTGQSVAIVDVNGDGFDDVILGAVYADDHKGAGYVVKGGANTEKTTAISISKLSGKGFKIKAEPLAGETGTAVTSAGDMNGDGIEDFVITSQGYNETVGRGYLVYGDKNIGSEGSLDLSQLNVSTGIKIGGGGAGENYGDFFGGSAVGGIDINNDDRPDLLIGAPGLPPNSAGGGFAFFGGRSLGEDRQFPISNLNGSNGFRLTDSVSSSYAGLMFPLSDINQDNISDFALSAPLDDAGTGKVYIVFGKADLGSSGWLSLESLSEEAGFMIFGPSQYSYTGWSAAGMDINQDGFTDILIGSPFNEETGSVFVIYGSKNYPSRINLSSPLNSTTGFRIDGEFPNDEFGFSLSAIGDFNGLGFGDVMIGAPGKKSATGASYVLFTEGGLNQNMSNLNGSNGFVIQGADSNDYLGFAVAGGGDINGDGIPDLVVSAPNYNQTGGSFVVYGKDAKKPTPPPTSPPPTPAPPSLSSQSTAPLDWRWFLFLLTLPAAGLLLLLYTKRRYPLVSTIHPVNVELQEVKYPETSAQPPTMQSSIHHGPPPLEYHRASEFLATPTIVHTDDKSIDLREKDKEHGVELTSVSTAESLGKGGEESLSASHFQSGFSGSNEEQAIVSHASFFNTPNDKNKEVIPEIESTQIEMTVVKGN